MYCTRRKNQRHKPLCYDFEWDSSASASSSSSSSNGGIQSPCTHSRCNLKAHWWNSICSLEQRKKMEYIESSSTAVTIPSHQPSLWKASTSSLSLNLRLSSRGGLGRTNMASTNSLKGFESLPSFAIRLWYSRKILLLFLDRDRSTVAVYHEPLKPSSSLLTSTSAPFLHHSSPILN